jgi:KRAB domain-containing zinc finger protein
LSGEGIGSCLGNLDNFNIHLNDHWSDDKCCPVCGLLINSKRFNFKQHLKIHTGEKPFVCHVCSRAFRQKAHMVKHVTTHRSEPRNDPMPSPLNGRHPELPNGSLDLSFQNGVIVQ